MADELPKIPSYSDDSFRTDNFIQVWVSNPKSEVNKNFTWIRIEENGDDAKWARLNPDELDDLIVELLYAKSRIRR